MVAKQQFPCFQILFMLGNSHLATVARQQSMLLLDDMSLLLWWYSTGCQVDTQILKMAKRNLMQTSTKKVIFVG